METPKNTQKYENVYLFIRRHVLTRELLVVFWLNLVLTLGNWMTLKIRSFEFLQIVRQNGGH
jgi:hypothetical protein